MFYIFKNKKTGGIVTGTDYRKYPPNQIMDEYFPPLIVSDANLDFETEIACRHINLKYYKAVPVVIQEMDDLDQRQVPCV